MVPYELEGTDDMKAFVGEIFKEKGVTVGTAINVYVLLVIVILDKVTTFWF